MGATSQPNLLMGIYTLATPASTPNPSIPTTQPLHYFTYLLHNDWTRQRWQGPGQGRRKASPEDLTRQHPGYHQARHQTSGSPWRCQAYLSHDLRGDSWCPEEARPYPLRVRWLNISPPFSLRPFPINHLLHAIFTTRRYPSAWCSWAEAGDGWRDTWVRMGLQTESGLALSFDHHAVT